MSTIHFFGFVLINSILICLVVGHGRLMDPPARNSMWRFGYPNPVNYNDNELFCGGYAVQWEQNKGKCGLCGDPYHVQKPRPHEAGGEYARGILSRHYTVGQEINIEIELTANHYGRFVFLLCPNNNPNREMPQECFDKYPLQIVGESEEINYYIPEDGRKKAIFRYKVQLPPKLSCTQCVIQWTYYTANQWGECSNGTEAQGCGKSETFRNCADVAIGPLPVYLENLIPFQVYFRKGEQNERESYKEDKNGLVVRDQVCVSTKLFRKVPAINDWCQTNCLRYPPNCPKSVCQCPTTCKALGRYAGNHGADVRCMDQCLVYPSKCNENNCVCHE